jgi:protein tyrosine/serine phosphatase
MSAFGLRDDRVLEALRILTNPQNQPVVIHCQHGADRTGAIVALYRIIVQGWSKADAVREMNEGGFHHSSLFRNLDRYVLAADVEALRHKLGIVLPAPATLTAVPAVALTASPGAGPAAPAAAASQ